jgi:RHS repeat-associated protein
LGQQTVCEINGSGAWQRGYVYLGGQLLAIQDVPQNRVLWTHQEPYSKAQRITDAAGAFVSGVEVEPFGLETNRSFDWNGTNQKRKFTTYDRDSNGGDEAMFRRYAPKQDRFAQPDPYDGSYSLANPQSLNRYAYVQGDPVNFVDPSGLLLFHLYTVCVPVIKHNIEGDAYLDGTFRCYGVYGSGDASGGGGTEPPAEEPTDCANFVDELIGRVSSIGSQANIGRGLSAWAKYTLSRQATAGELGFRGFREQYTDGGQNGFALVHIAGVAGATLIGDARVDPTGLSDAGSLTGYQLAQRQFDEDTAQLNRGLDLQRSGQTTINYAGRSDYPLDWYIREKHAERLDDGAGTRAGHILAALNNKQISRADARNRLFADLCAN